MRLNPPVMPGLFDESEKNLPNSLLLKSGVGLPPEINDFYRRLARRRGIAISDGVNEALMIAQPLLAERYSMDKCPQCQQHIEDHHIFCFSCGTKLS